MDKIFSSYLKFESPTRNKQSIIGDFIVLLYLIGILPILGVPFSLPFFLAAIIPAIMITLWGMVYIVDPYKNEKSYYLFLGVYGIVNTYVFFILVQKLLYVNIGASGPAAFIFSLLLFILLIFGMNWMNWKALYSGTYYKLQQKTKIPVGWAALSGVSYVLGQFILSLIYTDSGISILIIVCLSIISLYPAFLSINIHRYFFIKKNMDTVKQMFPEFGLPKDERYTKKKKKKKRNNNNKKNNLEL
ncbi:hypothetical protein [Psychrobacillus psychrotolerans]|uniref:hypothetical protein n=2 Tax=Psychrobacillus psychrotolerans TaxID=126156 RepID=UPI003315ED41